MFPPPRHRAEKCDPQKLMSDTSKPSNPTSEGSADPTAANSPSQPVLDTELEALRALAAKADENWDRYLRQVAEFENFKKRAARERQDAIRYATESLLERLIPVLDNFEMALSAANQPQSNSVESIRTGVSMIYAQLRSAVTEYGLEEILASNQPFDPNCHEAVSQQDSSEVPEGHVLQQLRKGYKLKDRLLRPATVVVARKASV